ncbi:hypothetical protein O6H91_03G119000 [Diphasiastrum complanatum]|uniref:Uncharacterized protein n=1 Tax=Diphasiastrum complanatum TaxID=34168 RepID=A0ACC2EAX0_DIPCM|nr:hypothetical protein O6H91_03G119000 [Diphasiastrum complanatum]
MASCPMFFSNSSFISPIDISIAPLITGFAALYFPLCTIAACASCLILYHGQIRAQGKSHVEGPFRWPVVGAYFEAKRNLWRLHDWNLSYFRRSKTILIDFGLFVNVLTVDPKNVEYMLSTNFLNYPKGRTFCERFSDWLGNGILNADGEIWKRHRKIASYEFSPRKLRDFSCTVFREDALKFARILDLAAMSQEEVDCQDLCMRMTLDSICKVGFGVDLNCCSPSLPAIPFGIAFDSANVNTVNRQVSLFWKMMRFWDIGSEKQMRKNLETLDSFIYSIIKKRKAEIETAVNSGKEHVKEDLLSRFMTYRSADGEGYSDKDLRDAIMNFMVAGRDTTAVTLSWFIHSVCENPSVAESIRAELNNVLGDTQNLSYEKFASLLTYNSLSKMHFLHAAISETLRLYPAVPKDSKFAANDDVLPDGTTIKKGYALSFVPYSMGRMEFLWGSDACVFRPERWLKNGIFQPESPFKFTAFQAGPRTCLGKDSAYLQMKITAALLMSFLTFNLVPGQTIRYRLMSVLSMLNGIKVQVIRRH